MGCAGYEVAPLPCIQGVQIGFEMKILMGFQFLIRGGGNWTKKDASDYFQILDFISDFDSFYQLYCMCWIAKHVCKCQKESVHFVIEYFP